MAYTNSPLVVYTGLSPNHSGQRTHAIDRITPHCVVGQLSAETICACFPAGRDASCNYGIGTDGRVSLCVEEKNRSWCSSSSANDQRAITIECASDKTEPYAMNSAVYNSLIKLCTDICKRNGKKKLLWFADKDKSLSYAPKSDEMVITVHRWFANKSCPGNWLYARLGDLAAKVTAALGGVANAPTADSTAWYRVRKTWADSKSQLGAYKELANAKACADKNPGYSVFDVNGVNIYTSNTTPAAVPFMVQVAIPDLNIRSGPGTDYTKTGQFTGIGSFTIVETASGAGSSTGWGRLKSGAGWISLDFCTKI
ncbi:N-acetylmuramoyl-L-alanine amidase [Agathobaculum sp. NTUH-O15-33]|uniref:N-acetylmuramoyl-L-alanine amidase n=1 Tax=Agathobaculum sp. NTUH-O15-33 TaxID=3079302 RepID=UPI0029584A66|nr:N-acetylmuramoyl-L-alanine amidase [Agathobaculum sp. NTUH-O15-33]WNX86047.1 N-acetylmuramoyl-L-alanine amidase [Agathobaculum sp. NTUH-O15-33]